MKKLISVALVLCMVLALIPAMAFAAVSTNPYIDGTEYDTIQEAVNAGNGKIIHLKTNMGGFTVKAGVSTTVHLDGYTITGTIKVDPGATLKLEAGYVNGTIVNNGTLDLNSQVEVTGTVENYGTMTSAGTVNGTIYCKADTVYNTTSSLTISNGEYDGTGYAYAVEVEKGCTATVNGGNFIAGSSGIFKNSGTLELNHGYFSGTLHTHGTDVAPKVNGGVYTDKDAVGHTSAPVAGYYQGKPVAGNKYSEYWISASDMKARAVYIATNYSNVDRTVDFLIGDVKLDGMPHQDDGFLFWYQDAWKSFTDGYGDKVGGWGNLEGRAEYGRGLVNGYSDFNVVAKALTKADIAAIQNTSNAAYSVIRTNMGAVKSVKAVYTGVNGNEVHYDIYVDVDLSKLMSFVADPTTATGYNIGNYNNAHAWVPIAIGFRDINNLNCNTDAVDNDKWVYTWGLKGASVSGYNVLMVGADHNDLGNNSSFDFLDKDSGLIYRCTVVVNNTKVDSYQPSQPDDPSSATQKPGTAASATGSQTGTGAGDGPARTGDNSTVMLWATLLVASAAGVAICVVDEAKKRSRK